LGSEFLLWLWLRAELVSQSITLASFGKFDVWLDRHLTLQSDIDPNERVTVRGAAPSGSPEAREAVRSQNSRACTPRAPQRGARFSCDLVAQRLAIAGARSRPCSAKTATTRSWCG